MGAPSKIMPPDSSVRALIAPQKSSSSPSSSVNSPTEQSLHVSTDTTDSRSYGLDFVSSSSSFSSSSLIPEGPSLHENVPQKRKKRNRLGKQEKHEMRKKDVVVDDTTDDKKHVPHIDKHVTNQQAQKPHIQEGCLNNICCKCAAGYTADCAAVCCCPLALLHLLALALIKLPSAVAWRMMVSVKKRLCAKKPLTRDDLDDGSPQPNSTPPWSLRDSPNALDPASHVVRFDSQNLLKHFQAENLGFGSMSVKRD